MENNNLFINRTEELNWLDKAYKKGNAQLLIVYGRRRIGKSFLITHFIKKKPSLYYLCSEENEKEQIIQLSKSLGKFFDDKALILNPFSRWEDFFLYLYEKTRNKKFILAIDEFPYLVNSNQAVPTIFQKYWDIYLKKTKICLILSGSSIGIMESIGINYTSPLYGRRTGQWKLLSLKFEEVMKFFNQDIEEVIRFYSIAGGVPFYLAELDRKITAIENIRKNMLKKGSIFYDEGEILLRSELKDPITYFSILKTIALGNTRQVEIANKVGIKSTSLPKYLTTLTKLGFVGKANIITEKEKSKKVRYLIKDNFIDFWFKFVEPSKRHIEENNNREINKLLSNFDLYVSKKFEELVRVELIKKINKKVNFDFEKIGTWWGYKREQNERKTMEIDVVALNEKTKDILFVECKWQNKVNAKKILYELKEKSKFVDWHNEKRKEHYAIFAKSFKGKIKEKNVYCFDLNDLKKVLKIIFPQQRI